MSNIKKVLSWSDLPEELLESIGKRLDPGLHVLRFRSVCKSWRYSLPLSHKTCPNNLLPLHLPYPIAIHGPTKPQGLRFTLRETSVYLLHPVPKNDHTLLAPCKGWLVKMQESQPGKMHLFSPLSLHGIKHQSGMFLPKVLNWLDFSVTELSKSYVLEHVTSYLINGVDKALMHPKFLLDGGVEVCMVLVLYNGGHLAVCRYGDEKWTSIGKQYPSDYSDIVFFKGQFHVVDRWGVVYMIDSSLRMIGLSPRMYSGSGWKRLVESGGSLYQVVGFFDTAHTAWKYDENFECYYFQGRCYGMLVDFRVYKLDEVGGKWDEVRHLGDQAIFLGDDCSFFVSAQDIAGCQANCIYFSDKNFYSCCEIGFNDSSKGLQGNNTGVFHLKDRSIRQLNSFEGCCQLFWPPPTWLASSSSSPGC